MKYKYVAQVDNKDCGIAALSMIMKKYNTNISLSKLRQLAHTDLNGTTVLGLTKAAEYFKFETKVINANENFLEDNTFEAPFIVHVVKNEILAHYYVIYEITKNHILVADPDSDVGIFKMKKEDFYEQWTGIAMFIFPSLEYTPISLKENSFKKFFPLILEKKKLVVITFIAAIIVLIIQIASTFYLQKIIDVYIPQKMNGTITIISLGMIIIYIYQQIFSFIQINSINQLSQSLTSDIVLTYIKHVLKLPMSFFSTRRTGEIISRFTDVSSIVDAISSVIISIFLDMSMIIIVSFFLLRQNMLLFCLILLSIPVYAIIIISFFRPFKKLSTDAMQANSIMSSSIIEDLNGISTIKSLGVEDERFSKIESEFGDYLNKEFKNIQTRYVQMALKTVTNLILNVVVLWTGSYLVITGKVTLGQVITFSLLISYFLTPLENIINLQPKLQAAKVAYNRLNEVYLVNGEEINKKKSYTNNLLGDIQINKLSYSYGLNDEILSDITLQIKMNSVTCLVGPSGSGKTTLAKLLVKFYDAPQGEILLNGFSLKDIDIGTLRQFINYLPQDPYIFDGTILDNLLIGAKEKIEEDELWAVLDIVEIKDEIKKMPLGLQTSLSVENTTISGGQKQRIALARTLLTDSKVLVLDEVTSQLDLLLERKIVNNLVNIQHKTIIFIAHRLEVAKKSDKIIALSEGKVIEQGEYKELIDRKGFFYSLIHAENKIDEENCKMKINQKYYNNKEQIQAAIPIVRNILDKLNGDNQEELKGMLINFQNELWSPKLDALLLNRMCLDISNCLVSNGIILSKEESNSFKDLFKLIQTSEK